METPSEKVIANCKNMMLQILESDRDPVGSVEMCQSLWGHARTFTERQPAPPTIVERYERLRELSEHLLGELGGWPTWAAIWLESELTGENADVIASRHVIVSGSRPVFQGDIKDAAFRFPDH